MTVENKIRVSYVDKITHVVVDIVDLDDLADVRTDVDVVMLGGSNIGDFWDGEKYIFPQPVEPPPAVPQIVSRAQGLIAIQNAGLLETINAYVEASTDDALKLAWANVGEFQRDSALINQLAPAMNITPEQLDALFIAAAAIDY